MCFISLLFINFVLSNSPTHQNSSMSYFPAINSTLSPVSLAQFLLEKYALAAPISCEILQLGINHTYLVNSAHRKYVFRVYFLNWRTKSEIREELTLLEALKGHGIAVSYPIKDRYAQYIQQFQAIEGNRYGVLFSFAEGETIRNPSTDLCYHFGKSIAQMHQVTENYTTERRTYDTQNLLGWAVQSLQNRFPQGHQSINYTERAFQLVNDRIRKTDVHQLRFGTVHLDLWYSNMKIKDDALITFFDFDNCGNGWLFLDLGYSLALLFRNEPNKSLFAEKRKQLLAGYESLIPMSVEEKELLPYGGLAIWLHYAGIHAYRANDSTNIFFSEGFLEAWTKSIDQWMVYHQIHI